MGRSRWGRWVVAAMAAALVAGCNGDQFRLPGQRDEESSRRKKVVKHETRDRKRARDAAAEQRRHLQEIYTKDNSPFGDTDFGAERYTPPARLVRHGAAAMRAATEDDAVGFLGKEILASLKLRPTLVVWLFDRSESAQSLRQGCFNAIDRVYQDFERKRGKGHESFRHEGNDDLLTAVMQFGQEARFVLEEPSSQLAEVQDAVNKIAPEDSGVENAFAALEKALERYGDYTSEGRYVMFVVVSDEAGDDEGEVDAVVREFAGSEIPVYVVGVPAPLGRSDVLGSIHAEATQNGTAVRQGPESRQAERVQLEFAASGFGGTADAKLDSGFGPFGLSRLCHATRGIYFMVPPTLGGAWTAGESNIGRYAPDYGTAEDYQEILDSNAACRAVVNAAKLKPVTGLTLFGRGFDRRNEQRMKRELEEAQRAAARLEPDIEALYRALAAGEKDRAKLNRPRWEAAYDLAMGRVLAAKARTEGYNLKLASMKSGRKAMNPNATQWVLTQTEEVTGNSQLSGYAEEAREYLTRVAKEHPGTPWAKLAEKELATPMGWDWVER